MLPSGPGKLVKGNGLPGRARNWRANGPPALYTFRVTKQKPPQRPRRGLLLPVKRAALLAMAVGAVLSGNGRKATAEDLFVSSVSVDQPRINIAFAPFGDPTNPFFGPGIGLEGEDIDTIQINAFWDTGASGIVISSGTAELLGMSLYQFGGQDVVFNDVGAGGLVPFNVSEQIVMRLAPSPGWFNNEQPYFDWFSSPNNFMTAYEAAGPVPTRIQIGPIGGESDLNVVGMPTMIGRKVVWDPRPTDNAWTLFDDDPDNDNFDSFVKSYSYDASHALGTIPAGSSDPMLNPGIPTADVSISLSYADFSKYTSTSPAGAEAPTHSHNPFLGPNPLSGPQPGDGAAPILRRGNLSMEGSWLLDSGASVSFISQVKATDLNVVYSSDPNHGLGSDDPILVDSVTGQEIPNQFQLPIQGISGDVLLLAGFYADSLTVPTDQGNPNDPNDPNHLHYVAGEWSLGAPVLVLDITLQNPDDPEDTYTIDGIFGMNYLMASVDADLTTFPPLLENFNFAPFDAIVFDEPAGKLYLSFNDGLGWPIPEPAGAGLLLAASALFLRRRRA